MRWFKTGANREGGDKIDYEGALSPLVIERYGQYMHAHRVTPAGLRASDNWQLGIPQDEHMKSTWRHFLDLWKAHRMGICNEEAACAILFGVMGYLHEALKRKQ